MYTLIQYAIIETIKLRHGLVASCTSHKMPTLIVLHLISIFPFTHSVECYSVNEYLTDKF